MAGRRLALLVATDNYSDATFRALKAPRADVDGLAEVLGDPDIGGYEIKTCYNAPAHELSLAIEDFFVDAGLEDLALLYISGHGVKDDSGQLYIAGTNSRHDRLGSTTVSAQFVRERMSHSRCRRIVVWLDCCYAGAFPPGKIHRTGDHVDVLAQLGGRGCAVMTSSSAMEYAFETSGDASVTGTPTPSVFTGVVIEGLRTGAADIGGDGLIDIDELYEYTFRHVRASTPQQTPTLNSRFEGKLFVATSPRRTPGKELPVDVQQAMSSALPSVRAAVVGELDLLADSADPVIEASAHAALTHLANDANKLVAATAETVLDRRRQRSEPPPEPEPDVRQEVAPSKPAHSRPLPTGEHAEPSLTKPALSTSADHIPAMDYPTLPPPLATPLAGQPPIAGGSDDLFAPTVRQTLRRRLVAIGSAVVLATAAIVTISTLPWDGSDQNSPTSPGPAAVGAFDADGRRVKVDDIGEVTVAVADFPTDYNNRISSTNQLWNNIPIQHMQPSAFVIDIVDGKQVIKLDGDVMESVKVVAPNVVEWKVRPEAVWSDETPVGCKDFYLNWLVARSTATATAWDFNDATPELRPEKISCTGAKTITTTFRNPAAEYTALFSTHNYEGLLPAHILEKHTGIADITQVQPEQNDEVMKKAADFYAKRWLRFDPELALSAGPYKIESYKPGEQQLVLVRNPLWWGNPPAASKITIVKAPEAKSVLPLVRDGSATVAALETTAQAITEAGNDPGVQLASGSTVFEHIDFNMGKPLFKQNPELRKAVALCLNRQAIAHEATKPAKALPLPGNLIFASHEYGYEDHFQDIGKQDVTAAKDLLEKSGWRLGRDNVYTKGEHRAAFKIGHKTASGRTATVQLIQASCQAAGIKIDDHATDSFNGTELVTGEFDVALFAWVRSTCKSCMKSDYVTGGSGNYGGYSNPAVDDLFAKANAQGNLDERVKLLNKADELIRDDFYTIPLMTPQTFAVAKKTLAPLTSVASGGGLTWNIFAWRKS
jgi:peptide/nickel transport system substrate-binding protein